MQFMNWHTGKVVKLEELAAALRPLLTQPEPQPEPVTLPAPTEAEQVEYWRAAAEHARREALDAVAGDMQALDVAKHRAELQLADARQEIEALRRRLGDAYAECGRVSAELAATMEANADLYRTMEDATSERDATRQELRFLAGGVVSLQEDKRLLTDKYRSAYDALSVVSVERDAMVARWDSIPWAALAGWLSIRSGFLPNVEALDWFDANCPKEVSCGK